MSSSNGSANGTAQSTPFPTHDQSTPPRNRLPNPFDLINSGGLGHAHASQTSNMASPSSSTPKLTTSSSEETIPAALEIYDAQYLPNGTKSLSGSALRSFLLGITLSLSTTTTLYFLQPHTFNALWRAPFFLATLSFFHFLEYYTTATYNTRAASTSSFLLSSNGLAYQGAHSVALAELLLTAYFFPNRLWLPSSLHIPILLLGLACIVAGQAIRSWAMRAAGQSFNHIVQSTRHSSHMLVTTGIYAYLRHPSYFGFFWWAIGTQLVLGNAAGFILYVAVLWRFFSRRIDGEEELLVAFFGDEYVEYRRRTRVGIPFIW